MENQSRDPLRKLLEKLLSEESDLLAGWIEEIKGEIERRKNLGKQLLAQIEKDKERIYPELYKIPGETGYKGSADERKTQLERELIELHREEREQRCRLWKNTIDLKRELMRLLMEYKRSMRIKKLMGDENGED